jgi:hypothetical protein
MQTHAHRAHWHAQETVAKTILAAAHAKRLAARGRLPHGRWATYRWRAIAARWGKALWTMQARVRRSLPLTSTLRVQRPGGPPRALTGHAGAGERKRDDDFLSEKALSMRLTI